VTGVATSSSVSFGWCVGEDAPKGMTSLSTGGHRRGPSRTSNPPEPIILATVTVVSKGRPIALLSRYCMSDLCPNINAWPSFHRGRGRSRTTPGRFEVAKDIPKTGETGFREYL
jgi:hypothetical protein